MAPVLTMPKREKDLSENLLEAYKEKHALLQQLLDAKNELLEVFRQQQQHLSDQLKEKTAELELSDAEKEDLTAQVNNHVADLATLRKTADASYAELHEKEKALQASRHHERQLASELQTIKTDFIPYNGSQKELEDKLQQAQETIKGLQETEVAKAREADLKGRLTETESPLRFSFEQQTPPVSFGAPSPIRAQRLFALGPVAPKTEEDQTSQGSGHAKRLKRRHA